jgi:hypothetical protein
MSVPAGISSSVDKLGLGDRCEVQNPSVSVCSVCGFESTVYDGTMCGPCSDESNQKPPKDRRYKRGFRVGARKPQGYPTCKLATDVPDKPRSS